MIVATCRTCHQDWGVGPTSILWELFDGVVLNAPCGHGRFVGSAKEDVVLAFAGLKELLLSEPDQTGNQLGEEQFRWEWQNNAYEAQARLIETYCKENPAPMPEPWDPPDITLRCVCGESVTMQGENDVNGEGWTGTCDSCGFHAVIVDGGKTVLYAQERQDRYTRAYRAWFRKRPQLPMSFGVAHLRESKTPC